MAVVRVRKRPDETNALRYLGASNWGEVAAFIAAFQDTGEPLFIQYSDPNDPQVTAAVQDNLTQEYQPMRDGGWIVVGFQNVLTVLRPTEYAKQWEPIPLVGV